MTTIGVRVDVEFLWMDVMEEKVHGANDDVFFGEFVLEYLNIFLNVLSNFWELFYFAGMNT